MQKHSIILALIAARCLVQVLSQQTMSTINIPITGSDTVSECRETHTIEVGRPRYMIQPREIIAEVGDCIEWQFWSGTHEILRGDLDRPCSPYESIHHDGHGFSSGEKVIETPVQEPIKFHLQVNESEPIFFYSGSNDDCSERMMMGVINPTEEKNLLRWYDSTWNLMSLVQQRDSENDEIPGTLPNRSCGDGDFTLSAGQVVGIALGGAVAILVAGLLGFFCRQQGRMLSRHIRRNSYPLHHQTKHTNTTGRHVRPSRAATSPMFMLETESRRRWSDSVRRHRRPKVPRQSYDARKLPPIPSQTPASNSAARNMSLSVAKSPIDEGTRENARRDACDGSDEIPVVFAPPSPVELPTQSRDWLSTHFRPTSVGLGLALSPNSNRQLSWSGNEILQRPSPV